MRHLALNHYFYIQINTLIIIAGLQANPGLSHSIIFFFQFPLLFEKCKKCKIAKKHFLQIEAEKQNQSNDLTENYLNFTLRREGYNNLSS